MLVDVIGHTPRAALGLARHGLLRISLLSSLGELPSLLSILCRRESVCHIRDVKKSSSLCVAYDHKMDVAMLSMARHRAVYYFLLLPQIRYQQGQTGLMIMPRPPRKWSALRRRAEKLTPMTAIASAHEGQWIGHYCAITSTAPPFGDALAAEEDEGSRRHFLEAKPPPFSWGRPSVPRSAMAGARRHAISFSPPISRQYRLWLLRLRADIWHFSL